MCLSDLTEAPPRERSRFINGGVPEGGLRGAPPERGAMTRVPWRISPQPFRLRPATVERLEGLGRDLLAFYRVANRLYGDAVRGQLPAWVQDYLDRGKGERMRELGRLRRYRTHVPRVIRPDLMALEDGTLRATELDAVPGGFGALAAFSRRYAELGFDVVGGADGVVQGLAAMFRDVAGHDQPTVAIVVSDESEDYRQEMDWVAGALRQEGLNAHQIHPRALELQGDALGFEAEGKRHVADVVYRFFELFDLPNIPKLDLLIYAMKQRLVVLTPPLKAFLEEKLLFTLFHHPELEEYWRGELEPEVFERLKGTLPETWILDPRPIPPQAAVSPPFIAADKPIRRWDDLYGLTQRQRRLVIKPSGFSELAWGGRGVTVGHDVNGKAWDEAVGKALESFDSTPHVIQPYHQSRRVGVSYFDFEADEVRRIEGRARISPFYFVVGDAAELAGVLVTVVPAANKVIHGTPEAVMAPAMVSSDAVI